MTTRMNDEERQYVVFEEGEFLRSLDKAVQGSAIWAANKQEAAEVYAENECDEDSNQAQTGVPVYVLTADEADSAWLEDDCSRVAEARAKRFLCYPNRGW